jgi:carboxylesterase
VPTPLRRTAPKRILGIGSDIKAAGVQELAYQETSVGCLREVAVLAALTKDLMPDRLPDIRHSLARGPIVPVANAIEIVTTIRSDDIRLLWLNNSYYVATLDNDKDLILERVGSFFTEITKVASVERS